MNLTISTPCHQNGLWTWSLVYAKSFKKVITFSRKVIAAFVSEWHYCFLTKSLDFKKDIINRELIDSPFYSMYALQIKLVPIIKIVAGLWQKCVFISHFYVISFKKNHTIYSWRWNHKRFFLSKIMSWGNTVDIHHCETYKDIRAHY